MYPGRSLSALLGLAGLAAGCEVVHFIGENIRPACHFDSECSLGAVCDNAVGVCMTPPPTANLDILFVVDNSASMAGRQKGLVASIPSFLRKLDTAPTNIDYHIGIVTSDIGTDVAPGKLWGAGSGSCDTFTGDDGLLQATPCTSRFPLTAEATAACQAFCPDPSFIPYKNERFIAKSGSVFNVPFDLQTDPQNVKIDLGPQRAFACMAVLGEAGCGVEGQLEAARRALDGHRPENAYFLRPDSLVAVIFVTDEDDCSVQPGRRIENTPESFDCPTPSQDAPFSCFNADFRCLARDVKCDEPLNTAGEKHNCREQADSYLEPVQTYVDFFAKLRPRNRLFIGGIWTLPALDQAGQLTVAIIPGSTPGSDRLDRVRLPCSGKNSTYPGAPQLRLSKFAQQFRGHLEADLCDASDYPAALERMAAMMLTMAGAAQ
ncbi:MAG TPA: hypothetical protein PLW65_06335 [Pseudomonadota bacterium]|nr:hypothetical protein [Pseudomonadota bacterium]